MFQSSCQSSGKRGSLGKTQCIRNTTRSRGGVESKNRRYVCVQIPLLLTSSMTPNSLGLSSHLENEMDDKNITYPWTVKYECISNTEKHRLYRKSVMTRFWFRMHLIHKKHSTAVWCYSSHISQYDDIVTNWTSDDQAPSHIHLLSGTVWCADLGKWLPSPMRWFELSMEINPLV